MMQLDEFYTVEKDARCWILTYEKIGPEKNDKGKLVISRDQTYHANLKQALVYYLDNCLKGSTDAQDVINRITEAEKKIDKAVLKNNGR